MSAYMLNPLYPKRAMSGGSPVAHQSLAVSTVAVSPTGYDAAIYNLVVLQVQAANVRVRWDGTSPDTNTGFILTVNTAYTWATEQYNAAKFIRDDSTDAVVFAAAMNT